MIKSSEKSFGIFFSAIFLFIAFWPFLNLDPINIWSLSLAFVFLLLAFLYPVGLKPLSYAWIKLGEILGKIVAPIVMAIIFFIIITPMSFLSKILGKDILMLKFSKNNSYWIKRKKILLQ